MSHLREWIVHRAGAMHLVWPDGVADAAGMAVSALAPIAITGNLRQVGRASRGYPARALKVSVRELEALASGKIDWIADERMLCFESLSATALRPNAIAPQALLCPTGRGMPLLGRILPTGKVETFHHWTSEEGPRLSLRYAGLPDAFALEATIGIGAYLPEECLVFQPIPPGELRDGELALLTKNAWEGESEIFTVRKNADNASFTLAKLIGLREEEPAELSQILRSARVIGAWKRNA